MNIVFDLGNVLIFWDPKAAFRAQMGSDSEIDAFFDRVRFFDWNACQDAGRSRAEAIAAAPTDAAEMLNNYFDQFALTIAHKVPGTWDIITDLKKRGHTLFGLTNWAVETWPFARKSHPELSDVFEDIVVSGFEGVIKPQREIYDLLCARNDLVSGSCLLIDDSLKNVAGAQAAGWQGHHFTNAADLRADLTERGLL
ncbi:MAG: HAD family phosphatase [Pseudomonadota bacterium]